MKTAVVIGSTGLIGQNLVEQLSQDASWGLILSIHRSAAQWKNPKIRSLLFDFENWQDLELQIKSYNGTNDLDFFCCLGTTIGKAKTKEKFKLIDFDYVVQFSKLAEACHAQQLLIVSAVNASETAKSFYLNVKFQMEQEVKRIFSKNIYFMHPSLLLGHRNEFRFAERIAIILAPVYSWIFSGQIEKYKPISALAVAKSMVLIASHKAKANQIVDGAEMNKIIQKFQT